MTMHRILFVDDELPLLEGLRGMLRRQRKVWDMHFVTSGQDALQALATQPFDLLVSDMKMPGMDGPALLTRARAEFPEVVRMVLSGQAEVEQVQRVLPVAHQYLHKPCEPEALVATIDRVLSIRSIVTSRQVRAAVGRFTSLPSPSGMYEELLKVSANPRATAHDYARIIGAEPAMSAKVLQVVNSAFFGLPQPVTSVQQAITYLGVDVMKGLALLNTVFAKADQAQDLGGLSVSSLQKRSLRTAMLSRALCTEPARSDEAFTAGLVHDVGLLVVASSMPTRYARAVNDARTRGKPYESLEVDALGVSHAAVGAYLLGSWGLPTGIVEAVALHHHPEAGSGVHRVVLDALRVAQAIAHRHADTGEVPGRDALVALGVDEDHVVPMQQVLGTTEEFALAGRR